MKVQDYFKSVKSYAFGVEDWVRKYFKEVGFEPKYTFVSDLAMVDWSGDAKKVKEVYLNIKKEWLSNYKAFTEVVMSVNMLSWANDKLLEQGFDDREEWIRFYSELYYQAVEDFYGKYTGNEEACDYFFKCTD